MELISKLEKIVLGWAKNVPHLPLAGQKWLGANAWWIVLVIAIINGIAVLISLAGIFTLVSLIGATSSAYYVIGNNYTSLALAGALVSFVFLVVNTILLAIAVKPLQTMQKKGWVLLFMVLLVEAVSVVVRSILSFSVIGFIINIIFGAVGVAIGAYLIFEMHDQFSHSARVTIKKSSRR